MSQKTPTFYFTIGESYVLQNGERVRLVSRDTSYVGHETVVDEHGCHRYDRSTHSMDAGRVTGTAHDYSHPRNILRCATQLYFSAAEFHRSYKLWVAADPDARRWEAKRVLARRNRRRRKASPRRRLHWGRLQTRMERRLMRKFYQQPIHTICSRSKS